MDHNHWRLLIDPPGRGDWNMAVDEAILEACGEGRVLPTLRLYAWDPPCLSLGFAQPVAHVAEANLNALGWQLVRRPTGGRAILHTDELTYAVIAPSDHPLVAGSTLESYQRIARALLRALENLSLEARADKEYAPPPGVEPGGPVCFEVPSNYEITVDGKKLIGSAQARRKNGVLQHGTLPLHGDITRILQALQPDGQDEAEKARRLLDHATTVELALNTPVTWQQAAQALIDAFEHVFGFELETGELSQPETARAREMVAEKYGHPAWTYRV